MPIYEPGLDELVADNVKAGRLSFTTDLAGAVGRGRRGVHRRRHAVAARRRLCRSVLRLCRRRARSPTRSTAITVVVTKSTVPVGTGDEVERIIRDAPPRRRVRRRLQSGVPARGRGDQRFHAPRPGGHRHRSPSARAQVMRELYRPLYLIETPIVFTGRRTAELIKYAANAFLATKITFINEIADLCEKVGADVHDVAARHRPRRPHRHEVPACRPGLRRLVLPQGHPGAGANRPGRRRAAAHRRDGGRGQRRAQAGDGRARSSRRCGGDVCAARPSRCWA